MYKVYWTEENGQACSKDFVELTDSLAFSAASRNEGKKFVTMINGENPNQVGKMGVDSVVDGKLPNGEDYPWMKRRRQ